MKNICEQSPLRYTIFFIFCYLKLFFQSNAKKKKKTQPTIISISLTVSEGIIGWCACDAMKAREYGIGNHSANKGAEGPLRNSKR